jgi:hypothetical protein
MIDLGQIPERAALDHPDWCSQNRMGQPVERRPGLYAACPMGGYQTHYVREIVREILERYPLDCVKFGGGSFGFGRDICYCPNCRESYAKETGQDLPQQSNWEAPDWRAYVGWRLAHARERVHQLGDIVHSLDPQMPFMGNSVCFGDPHWTTGSALDVENQAAVADAVQVEIQTRARYDEACGEASWQYLSWPAETARFMTSVSDKPIWVVASYFLAWPWRRSAMAPVEQKVYLAQVAANGADPMVNLSGGPPAVHEDPRGFDAIRELYGYLDANHSYYQDDTSGANVAIVYSLETLFFYGQNQPEKRYVREIRGVEQALHEAHIPFDIISTRVLDREVLARYQVLVLPNLACLSDREVAHLSDYVRRGGSIVSTFETGLYDEQGQPRDGWALGDLLGVRCLGQPQSSMASEDEGYKQVYMDIAASHPILEGIEGTSLLPMGGDYCRLVAVSGADVPLVLSAPFIVFPEGWAYPTRQATSDPLVVAREHPAGGRTIHFAGRPGDLFWVVRYPDHGRLLVNAVTWAAHRQLPVRVSGPKTLQVSVRRQPGRSMVHLINLTGGERFFQELIPLRDVEVTLRVGSGIQAHTAYLLSDRVPLPVEPCKGGYTATVPHLTDYDVLVFELQGEREAIPDPAGS